MRLAHSLHVRTRIGIDLVRVDAIERSMAEFGARFTHRLFAPGELADSMLEGRLDPAALATRFAAKEATIKAFDLCEAGVGWTQVEMVDARPGQARILLHGAALRAAGDAEIAVSTSYVGDMACAIVVARAVLAQPGAGEAAGRQTREGQQRPARDSGVTVDAPSSSTIRHQDS